MKTKSLLDPGSYQRRVVLKGALAACCAFALPTLTGCGKREEPAPPAPTSGMAPPPTPQIGEQSTPSPSADQSATKLSKTQVQYQQQPKGDQQCSKCMHYIAESSTCKLVEGPINPDGWCTLWAQKQG